MVPNVVSDDVYPWLEAAVQPTAAEIVAAKQQILHDLADGASRRLALEEGVVSSFGVPAQPRDELYDVPTDKTGEDAVDREDHHLRRVRLRHATRLAIAELVANGSLIPTADPEGASYIEVSVRRGGHSGGERIRSTLPRLEDAYDLTRRNGQSVDPLILSADGFCDGLSGLLDLRARRCADEALTAARRGLYLSSVNLLGAVSEAAWYSVGEALRGRDTQLAADLDADRTAQVQRVVANLLGQVGSQTTANELRAHAAYLRDLRNYGVHPAAALDASQEHAFTEIGCLALVMSTHRYLVRLREAAIAAGVALPDK